MAQQQPEKISALLDSLACELIGMCLDTLAEGDDLYPTVAYASSAKDRCFLTFDDDSPDRCLAAAHNAVRQLDKNVKAYAVAYDGFVQLDNSAGTQDALLVEFGERGLTCAYSAYVCYWKGNTPEEFTSSEPLAAGEETLLLG